MLSLSKLSRLCVQPNPFFFRYFQKFSTSQQYATTFESFCEEVLSFNSISINYWVLERGVNENIVFKWLDQMYEEGAITINEMGMYQHHYNVSIKKQQKYASKAKESMQQLLKHDEELAKAARAMSGFYDLFDRARREPEKKEDHYRGIVVRFPILDSKLAEMASAAKVIRWNLSVNIHELLNDLYHVLEQLDREQKKSQELKQEIKAFNQKEFNSIIPICELYVAGIQDCKIKCEQQKLLLRQFVENEQKLIEENSKNMKKREGELQKFENAILCSPDDVIVEETQKLKITVDTTIRRFNKKLKDKIGHLLDEMSMDIAKDQTWKLLKNLWKIIKNDDE